MAYAITLHGNYIYIDNNGNDLLDEPAARVVIEKKFIGSDSFCVFVAGSMKSGYQNILWSDFTLDGVPFASLQDFEDWKNENTGDGAGGSTPFAGPVSPNLIEALVDGSTIGGVYKSMALLFRGNGGSLDGVSVPNNFSASYNAEGGTLDPIAYTVPTGGNQKIIISFTS